MSDKILACRCEDVTAREIARAVREGHRDLESVKRFTGFGTGWCQGKHCLALCAKLVARYSGEPVTEPFTSRPPLHPVPLAQLASLLGDEEP